MRRETADAVSLGFIVPPDLRDAFAYQPGQYLTLRTHIDGEDVRRCYSICAAPQDDDLRVAIKAVDGGLFTTFATQSVRVGDHLDVMAPLGRFVLPLAQRPRHILGIAAGSGITPILAIMRSVLLHEPGSRFTLLYGNRNSSSVMFKSALDDLKDSHLTRLSVHHVLSRESSDIALAHGRLDQKRIAALASLSMQGQPFDEAFLCGPEGMIDDARVALSGLGMHPASIHSELFTPAEGALLARPPVSAPDAQDTIALAVRLDGIVHHLRMAASQTILDAASTHGLELPFSCRGGMCSTCRAHVDDGTVTMDRNFSLEQWELDAGFVLTCQARAQPNVTRIVIDFDRT